MDRCLDAADRRRRGHPKTTWTEAAADESEQFKYLSGVFTKPGWG